MTKVAMSEKKRYITITLVYVFHYVCVFSFLS